MSFFSAIKSIFGFGSNADEVDDLLSDTVTIAEGESYSGADNPQLCSPEPVKIDETRREAIFNHVLQVFNEALPDFIAGSVNPEAQKQRLYDSLDAGLKEYLESLASATHAYCDAEWKSKHESLAREMAELRKRSEEVEHRTSEIKQQQLSADRQKRALTERVNDLENQRAALEAEREQYELENRSLLSRIKAAGVHSEDIARLQAEADDLRQQIKELHNDPEGAVARVRETYNKEIEALKEGNDALHEQVRVATEMAEDMRRRHREAVDKCEAKQAEVDSMRIEHNAIRSELEAALKEFEAYDSEIEASKKLNTELRNEIKNLRETITENLRLQAERENELLREIESLRPPTVVNEMTVDFGITEETAPKISEDDLSAIEESFETGEWFTATPPPETPSMRPADDATDFGYQAPARRKHIPDNPAQLSLF